MTGPVPETPTVPFGVRLVLMAILPLLALTLYLDGQHYDPDLVELGVPRSAEGQDAALLPDAVSGMQRAGQVRLFDRENLYEYINGHAEYFIGSGFAGLIVGEYGDAGDGQPALVVSLYDMGEPLNSFGVLVEEAGDQDPVDVGAMGFRSGQGLSFILGRYYAQLRLFDADVPVEDAGADLARILGEEVEDLEFAFRFPDLGRATGTRYIKEFYRGLEFLNGVLERGFERNGVQIQTFLVQASEQEIGELVAELEGFFREDEMPYRRIERDGLGFYQIDDPYEGEWFFVPLDEALVGVYAPLDEELIAAIQAFAGNAPGP